MTLAAVLSLGLGIGANTTIVTWVQAVLFRPIPLAADPGAIRIAAMENRDGQSGPGDWSRTGDGLIRIDRRRPRDPAGIIAGRLI